MLVKNLDPAKGPVRYGSCAEVIEDLRYLETKEGRASRLNQDLDPEDLEPGRVPQDAPLPSARTASLPGARLRTTRADVPPVPSHHAPEIATQPMREDLVAEDLATTDDAEHRPTIPFEPIAPSASPERVASSIDDPLESRALAERDTQRAGASPRARWPWALLGIALVAGALGAWAVGTAGDAVPVVSTLDGQHAAPPEPTSEATRATPLLDDAPAPLVVVDPDRAAPDAGRDAMPDAAPSPATAARAPASPEASPSMRREQAREARPKAPASRPPRRVAPERGVPERDVAKQTEPPELIKRPIVYEVQ